MPTDADRIVGLVAWQGVASVAQIQDRLGIEILRARMICRNLTDEGVLRHMDPSSVHPFGAYTLTVKALYTLHARVVLPSRGGPL